MMVLLFLLLLGMVVATPLVIAGVLVWLAVENEKGSGKVRGDRLTAMRPAVETLTGDAVMIEDKTHKVGDVIPVYPQNSDRGPVRIGVVESESTVTYGV